MVLSGFQTLPGFPIEKARRDVGQSVAKVVSMAEGGAGARGVVCYQGKMAFLEGADRVFPRH